MGKTGTGSTGFFLDFPMDHDDASRRRSAGDTPPENVSYKVVEIGPTLGEDTIVESILRFPEWNEDNTGWTQREDT